MEVMVPRGGHRAIRTIKAWTNSLRRDLGGSGRCQGPNPAPRSRPGSGNSGDLE